VNSRFSKTRSHHGFTLVEILVAVAIVSLILATVLGTITGIMSSSETAVKKAELYQTGRSLMDLLSADIRGLFRVQLPEGGVFFRGITETAETDLTMSRLAFITTHSLPVGIERNPFLSEVGYRVKKNENDGLYSLWRRAQFPPEYPYDEGGTEVPVCRIIESFHLEFVHNNGRRTELFGFVPDAVILSFTLNLEGEREDFVTMVRPMVRIAG